MPQKTKYYVVWEGQKTGVFSSWDECKEQVSNYPNAKYKSFASKEEAENAYQSDAQLFIGKKSTTRTPENHVSAPKIRALAVDAACSGNPGRMEYRGVMTDCGEQIFHMGPFEDSTNNIGEFLALVHGLALIKQKKWDMPLYSDSRTAISWIKAKKCKTKLAENEKNRAVFELIRRAEKWLAENQPLTTPINKWETEKWGEIPADFGRK